MNTETEKIITSLDVKFLGPVNNMSINNLYNCESGVLSNDDIDNKGNCNLANDILTNKSSVDSDVDYHDVNFTLINVCTDIVSFELSYESVYVIPGKEHFVCKLNHCLYGLKQCARCGNHRINKVLIYLGLEGEKQNLVCI